MGARSDSPEIKDLQNEVNQCHANADRTREWWRNEQRRYSELHPGQTHPDADRYEAEMVHLEQERALAQKKLDEAKAREGEDKGLERDEPERRRGGRGR